MAHNEISITQMRASRFEGTLADPRIQQFFVDEGYTSEADLQDMIMEGTSYVHCYPRFGWIEIGHDQGAYSAAVPGGYEFCDTREDAEQALYDAILEL